MSVLKIMAEGHDDMLSLLDTSDLFLYEDHDLLIPTETSLLARQALTTSMTEHHPSLKLLTAKQSRRMELRLLRDEFMHLCSLHESLKNRGRKRSKEEQVASSSLGTSFPWKAIAHKQLQLREAAVQENLWLRNQLAEIASLGGRLQQQLKKQQAGLQDVRSTDSKSHIFVVYYNDGAFVDLLGQIPHIYMRTQEVVDQHRLQLDLRSTNIREFHVNDQQDKFDLFEARVVPFALHATANAVWEWMGVHRHPAFHSPNDQKVIAPNTIQRSFSGIIESPATQWSCRGRMVTRRYDEIDRVVFITIVLAQSADTGALIQHSQWIVVTRPPMVMPTTSACAEIQCFDMTEVLDVRAGKAYQLPQVITDGVDENRDDMNMFVDTKLLDATRVGS